MGRSAVRRIARSFPSTVRTLMGARVIRWRCSYADASSELVRLPACRCSSREMKYGLFDTMGISKLPLCEAFVETGSLVGFKTGNFTACSLGCFLSSFTLIVFLPSDFSTRSRCSSSRHSSTNHRHLPRHSSIKTIPQLMVFLGSPL